MPSTPTEKDELTVLVVDDSATDRALAGALVQEGGWKVDYAEDGQAALEKLAQRQPHVVLTDLRMPRMDGLELVGAVRRQFPTIPVVLMTGVGSEDIAAEALRTGAASYVPKRYLPEELLAALDHVAATIPISMTATSGLRIRRQLSSFELGYEAEGLVALVNFSQDTLAKLHFADESELIRIGMAFTEALTNAIEHGNLELDSDLKDRDAARYDELRTSRAQQPPFCNRKVFVTLTLSAEAANITVRDEGSGFNPDKLPDPTDLENLNKVGGRGMLLIRTFMDEVTFNETGNEITMIKRRGDRGDAE